MRVPCKRACVGRRTHISRVHAQEGFSEPFLLTHIHPPILAPVNNPACVCVWLCVTVRIMPGQVTQPPTCLLRACLRRALP